MDKVEWWVTAPRDDQGELDESKCGCCGDCACGSAKPIDPPSDPDFTKKLHGDDPSVTPFTQVTITYDVRLEGNAAYGTVTSAWEDGSDCGEKKLLAPISSDPYGYCGYSSVWVPGQAGSAGIQIVLSNDGCLTVLLLEDGFLGGIQLAGTGDNIGRYGEYLGDCSVDDGGGTITIQGVSYPTVRFESWINGVDDGSVPSGTLDITFS